MKPQAVPGDVRFSVVVPTFRRSAALSSCLRALERLNYPRELFEVILVDDGGGLTSEALAPLRDGVVATLVTQPHSGPAAARNAGAARAANPFLALTDDDCQPDPEWLGHLAAHFARHPEHMLGGPTVNALTGNPFATASHCLLDYLHDKYRTADGQPRFFATSNLALPVALFRKLGGFDTGFRRAGGEDREFCARWHDAGFHMAHVPQAVVRHAHEMNAAGFVRQHVNYGAAAIQYWSCRVKSGHRGLSVEPFSFYWGMLRSPFQRPMRRSRLLIASLLALSQMAYALGMCVELVWQRSRRQ
jgi:GT2 family glycosyltransferase